jgi:parallel beta-helix repeat protein
MFSNHFRRVVLGLGSAVVAQGHAFAIDRVVPDAYPNIQAALDAALDGDKVKVRAGTYYESLTLSKQVMLTAYKSDEVIVDALGGIALTISGDGATVTEITFRNALTGIVVASADGVTIAECEIESATWRGIYLQYATAALVEDNTIENAGLHGIGSIDLVGGCIRDNRVRDAAEVGIRVMGEQVVVVGNRVVRSGTHGIQLGDSGLSLNCRRAVVRANEIEDAGAHGIYFDSTATDCVAAANSIETPMEFGISLALGADRALLETNEITYAVEGIGVLADEARLVENSIKYRQYGIGLALSSNNCLLYGNKANKNDLWGFYLDGAGHSVTGNTAKNNGSFDAFANGSVSGFGLVANEFETSNF